MPNVDARSFWGPILIDMIVRFPQAADQFVQLASRISNDEYVGVPPLYLEQPPVRGPISNALRLMDPGLASTFLQPGLPENQRIHQFPEMSEVMGLILFHAALVAGTPPGEEHLLSLWDHFERTVPDLGLAAARIIYLRQTNVLLQGALQTARTYVPASHEALPIFSGLAGDAYENLGTPEAFWKDKDKDTEHMFIETMRKLVEREILATGLGNAVERHAPGDFTALKKIFRLFGDQGIIRSEFPDEFGGAGFDLATSAQIIEAMSRGVPKSIPDSLGVNMAGIGSMPIILYGTEEQKQKYLPGMAAGTTIGAFALTEPDAGSDTSGMKTTATVDGENYVLNGSKTFITNGGIADVFIVFAKLSGRITAFIVDKETAGFTVVREEEKMGLHGTSTVQLSFADVKIPKANLLGAEGQGQRIALSTLTLGRWKLATSSVANAKEAVDYTVKYVRDRKQFGSSIAEYGAVRAMVAGQTIGTFVAESMTYRIAGEYDAARPAGVFGPVEKIALWNQFSVQAGIAKVFDTENFQNAADLGVQAHGGYGFIEEYPIARLYRDSRVTRIYEGSNEIQRLFVISRGILSQMAKAGMDEKFHFDATVAKAMDHIEANFHGDVLVEALKQTEIAKLVANEAYRLVASNTDLADIVVNSGQPAHKQQGQAIALHLANLAISAYAMDSAIQRALKLGQMFGDDQAKTAVQIARVFAQTELRKVRNTFRELNNVLRSYDLELTKNAETVLAVADFNTPMDESVLNNEIAQTMLDHGGYSIVPRSTPLKPTDPSGRRTRSASTQAAEVAPLASPDGQGTGTGSVSELLGGTLVDSKITAVDAPRTQRVFRNRPNVQSRNWGLRAHPMARQFSGMRGFGLKAMHR
ncbi:MAG TPA: hypothetical protein DDW49_05125 [Deltaproteobacteria bacterium]|nr:MAG: hypothetical protein A2048_04375 [Deltaproteobacteria bacterium GWA2_45_12]HBF12758.1 hypothetical protein [Deltaproteobacteria bacterium]